MGKSAEQVRRHEKDTGTPEAQIAFLTDRVTDLTGHLQRHRNDFSSQRGLQKLVGRRSRLLRYLKRRSEQKYLAVVDKLGLRK
jgi:small subunit ribosomal protein S15